MLLYVYIKRTFSEFWNEVPYMRVAQGTYSTKSETLPLPWPALRYHSQRCVARTYAERTYPKPADSVSAMKEKPTLVKVSD